MIAQIEPQHYVKLDELLSLCREKLHRFDEDLIRRAFFLCYRAHSEEKRASGEPYFFHPVEVAKIMLNELPLDDVSVAAALLHDVIEDTDYSLDDLNEEFGEEVAAIVEGLTKIAGFFANREIKEAESFRKMLLSMINDIRVILIKFCDRLHNMRTLDALPPHRQLKIALETRDIYAPFANRFGLGRMKSELEDLAFKYIDREAYETLSSQINFQDKDRQNYLARFAATIEKELHKRNFKFSIAYRPKHLYSIHKKIVDKGKSFDQIYDLYAIRIILDTDNSSECFAVYGYITQQFTPIPERFKDYISVPKHNGYQSLHTTVVGPNGQLIEIQIRTKKMDEFAESGVAAHWRYKEKITTDDKAFDNVLKWARELIENASSPREFMEGFRMNLYQDEIYIFTPKGDMKMLPVGSTPLDFAFEIHTEVGSKCIGAKVNGKIVTISTKLKSGDQVEIITSKNQTPKPDWEKIVVTHRAKVKIRQLLNDQRRKEIEEGKSLWTKAVQKTKKVFSEGDIAKIARRFGINTAQDFFQALATKQIDPESVKVEVETPEQKAEKQLAEFESFVKEARFETDEQSEVTGSAIVIEGLKNIAFAYGKCCNPVPGDDIIGLVTAGGVVKVHRRNCKNMTDENLTRSPKVVSVRWRNTKENNFLAGLKIFGEDKIGMTNNITQAILKAETNIRSITLNAKDGMFEGTVILQVKNTDHLSRLVEKIKRVEGVFKVERFSKS
ncbi:MAG: bifunctional (p)ppGpp synthetase/guanosine-3',5'-bis(diphosphate) 3'-pyrophosphohydrolase [Chloroherpetonaceae bacterium]|nr:bifunctional (p)ppGpp synthetase/guanosine-3',5'-bis(diphosphate) 3'-pyrophosphohydrolase [Chloroherpetonaceae bacterium]